MLLIRELMSVSDYRPSGGYSMELMELTELGLSRPEAPRHWVSLGRTEKSFYKAYKVLKDDLARLAFLNKKSVMSAEGRRMKVWEKYKLVQQLLIAQKKPAAVELAVELVTMAVKAGFTEIVLGLSSLLENHFGSIELDTRRYLRYRKLRKEYSRLFNDELDVKALHAKLVF